MSHDYCVKFAVFVCVSVCSVDACCVWSVVSFMFCGSCMMCVMCCMLHDASFGYWMFVVLGNSGIRHWVFLVFGIVYC